MDTKQLADGICVASQRYLDDVVDAARDGFTTLINNRPDNEVPDQPSSTEIGQVAREHGLDYHHIPVVVGRIDDADVAAFAAAVRQSKGPLLAYCSTGTRSTALWALSEAGKRSTDSILLCAANAGFDLGKLAARLNILAERAGAATQG